MACAAGYTRYQCKGHAHLTSATVGKAAQYEQVDKLLIEFNPQRSIAGVTGVARMTVAKRAKKAQSPVGIFTPAPERRPAA